MDADKALTEIGLTPVEVVVCRLADAVRQRIDLDKALWRSAGSKLYQRFETRIRSTAYEPDPVRWVFRFATKCSVSPQLIPPELIERARALDRDDARIAMKLLREQPGLVVTAVRALIDIRRAERKNNASNRDERKTRKGPSGPDYWLDDHPDDGDQSDLPLFG